MAEAGGLTLFAWSRRRDRPDAPVARSAFKARVAGLAGLGEHDALTVSEINCFEPGCPDVETVILLMRVGQPTRAVKLRMSMMEASDDDILHALRQASAMQG